MKYKELKYIFVLSVAALLFMPALISAKGDKNGNGKRTLAKTSAGMVATAAMNINNLNALQNNTGFSDYNPDGNLEGTEYPKGTGRNAIYESGFLWGGYKAGTSQVQVGGSAYRSGLQPGPILSDGQAADPTDPRWSIYRVRPDVYPGGPEVNLSGDAASTSYWDPANPVTADQIRQQYEHDWTYWPAHGNPNNSPDMDLGAPFKDVNNDGKYEPDIDVPGVPGADQTIFYTANDMNQNATENLYGTDPLGLEIHVTMWAYAQQGPLGNMYFKKFDIINKGYQKYTIDSMIVAWWADVDLGSASDDLVGNDTTLSLTYVYNSNVNDAVYQPLPPPATGGDFFQGPLLKGVTGEDRNKNGVDDSQDYAIFNGQVVGPGYINLPMTAAFTFTNPGSGLDPRFNDPSQGQPIGSTQFYYFMKGLNNVGGAYIDPNGDPSKFIFSGDPVTNTGWVDDFGGRDVRSGMASGPFTMAPGDTQEVVVAELVAGAVPGISNLQAITLLKTYDKTAQNAYDHFFNLPKAPPAPKVTTIAQDRKIIIDWGEDLNAVNATESSVIHDVIDSVDASGGGDYRFEGYNVYQLPYAGATIEQAQKIATYDVINNVTTIPYTDPVTRTVEPSVIIQKGSDSGIRRYFVDSLDAFRGNKELNNGTPYYFAVTAYSYNAKGVQQALETPIAIVADTPHAAAPGTRYFLATQDTITVNHVAGKSDGIVVPTVVDPTKMNGNNYEVSFTSTAGTDPTDVADAWQLVNTTTNKTLYTSSNLSGSIAGDSLTYPTIDGFYMKVQGPPEAVNHYVISGTRWVGYVNWGGGSFGGGIDVGRFFFGSDLPASDYVPIIIKFTGGSGTETPSVANGWSQGAVYWRSDGYAYHGVGWMPFQVFDISDPNNPVQINASFVEDANAGSANLKWDMGWDGTKFADLGGREYLFFNDTPYDPNHYNGTLDGTVSDVLYAWWPDARSASHPYLEAPWSLTLVPNYPILLADKYDFTATKPTVGDQALAKEDVNRINVFPNPYYGVNYLETTKYSKFVTFNHLPEKATIRIFNLAGYMVKSISHTNGTLQQWDLTNRSGLPVSSGLYIAYIDMPDIGATKILKFSIIQEQQIPDHF